MVRVTRLCIWRTRMLMMWAMRLLMMDRREVTQMENNTMTTRMITCKIRTSLNKMGGKVNQMQMRWMMKKERTSKTTRKTEALLGLCPQW